MWFIIVTNVALTAKTNHLTNLKFAMNDEVLQHHFDEVFGALQDRENFEIFTKLKATSQPRVKKTFFKIVTSSQVNSGGTIEDAGVQERVHKRFTFHTPYDCRSTCTVKAKAVFRPKSPRVINSRPMSPQPVTSSSIGSTSRYCSLREDASDVLGECRHCGRYFLGDYLVIHEDKCSEF